ncbi:hypothetical protein [Inquilinus limosus]|nr:hypothetical protein [Inquilinus limosus]
MKTVQTKTFRRRPRRPMQRLATTPLRQPAHKAELSRAEIRRIVLDILG